MSSLLIVLLLVLFLSGVALWFSASKNEESNLLQQWQVLGEHTADMQDLMARMTVGGRLSSQTPMQQSSSDATGGPRVQANTHQGFSSVDQ